MTAPEITHYVDQYTDDVTHLLQDLGQRFEGLVTTKTVSGEGSNFLNQFGATTAQQNEDRRGDTPHIDVTRFRRWVFPTTAEWGHLLERRDFVRMMQTMDGDKGKIQEAGVMAIRRFIDRNIIIPAFFADAKTGQNGAGTTTFPSSQQVSAAEGAGAATGMNLEKLRAALEILQINDAPGPDEPGYEMPVMKIGPRQNRELLADYQAASTEFKAGVVIKGPRVVEAYGVRIQIQNGLETDSSGYRRCPLWLPSGMGLGIWEDEMIKVGERFDKKWNVQIYMEKIAGATRLDEEKVIEVPCAES